MNDEENGKGRHVLTAIFAVAVILVDTGTYASAASQEKGTFEEYRAEIKKQCGIDISDFKEALTGGRADGKKITDFDLNQLVIGIGVELEHTNDKYRALEISMDHLAEFPDYYDRLLKMEEEAEKEHGHK